MKGQRSDNTDGVSFFVVEIQRALLFSPISHELIPAGRAKTQQ